MSALSKLLWNFDPRHIRKLGLCQYIRLLGKTVINAGKIARSRDLRALDCAMGNKQVHLNFHNRKFTIDCPAIDALITDGTYTYGIVREMFLRDCYIRGGLVEALANAEYVLDLGANRGAFSIMSAVKAKAVVAVEVLPQLVQAVQINAKANGLTNVHVESAFIGNDGEYAQRDDAKDTSHTTILELLRKHQLPRFDVVKIDIEGSEYALFQEPAWLDYCGAICMEVHPDYGNVSDILGALKDKGFTTQTADHMMHDITDPQQAEFIWAWRPTWENRPTQSLQKY